jgi:hypothetical protein
MIAVDKCHEGVSAWRMLPRLQRSVVERNWTQHGLIRRDGKQRPNVVEMKEIVEQLVAHVHVKGASRGSRFRSRGAPW